MSLYQITAEMQSLLDAFDAHGAESPEAEAAIREHAAAIAEAFDAAKQDDVTSPTFTLVQTYETPIAPVHHYDLWRLDGPGPLAELGWDEAQDDIVLVEWPERLGDEVPAGALRIALNASPTARIPGNLNLTFSGADAQALMKAMPDLCVSTGSACSSAEVEPSYVLRALGLSDDAAGRTLRIGIGRFTSPADIDAAAGMLIRGCGEVVK